MSRWEGSRSYDLAYEGMTLMDWLHDPDCGGELVEVKHPRWPIQQEVLVT